MKMEEGASEVGFAFFGAMWHFFFFDTGGGEKEESNRCIITFHTHVGGHLSHRKNSVYKKDEFGVVLFSRPTLNWQENSLTKARISPVNC